jgi:glycosyltransferase involved in cell wall biosynthesis
MRKGVEVKVVLSKHNLDLDKFRALGVGIETVVLPTSKPLLFFPLQTEKISIILGFLRNCDFVYFPMPHPRDNQIIRKLLSQKITIGRGIHDFSKHPGDIWPNRFSTRRQIKLATFLVAHSNFVSNKIRSSKVSVLPLPSSPIKITYEPKEGYVLFVGRLVKYKGLNLLSKAWVEVTANFPSSFLHIAGRGRANVRNLSTSISLDRRWLDDAEIWVLVSKANCVVFPYIEASQSGMVPVLDSLKIPLVVTNVGGLKEQAMSPTSKVVNPAPDEISHAISECISNWRFTSEERIYSGNLELSEFLLNLEFDHLGIRSK